MATNNAINETWPIPAFSAYLSAPVASVTGDGSDYTLIADTATYNYGTNYNTSTGVFTAPVKGLYSFTTNMILDPLTVGSTFHGTIRFHTNSTDYYGGDIFAAYLIHNVSEFAYDGHFSSVIYINAGDVVTTIVNITLAVSAKSIGLLANASIPTIFSGYLIRQIF